MAKNKRYESHTGYQPIESAHYVVRTVGQYFTISENGLAVCENSDCQAI